MKSKKKILFFLPSFAGGGAEKVTITFINNIPLEEYEVHLAVLNGKGKLKKLLNKNIIYHNLNTIRLRYSIFKIIFKILFLRPKIIFSTFININIFLLFLKIFLPSMRLMIRAESVPSTHFAFLPYRSFYKFCYEKLYKSSDILIASCNIIKKEFIENGAKLENIQLVPNPVEDLINLNDNDKKRHPGTGIRIVAAGRLTNQKGYDYLLEVLSKVETEIHCTILGEGELEGELKNLAKDLNILERVKFEGYVDNPYPYLNGADALVITSNFEGLPNIALESLSLGTPVISTPNCGGLIELKNAKIFQKGEPFINAINNIKININSNKTTLLDDRFNVNNVMNKFILSLNKF